MAQSMAQSMAQTNPRLQLLLEQQLNTQLRETGLMGMGAVVIQNGEIRALATEGKQEKSRDTPLSVQDKWHLGSVTKSMTATVIARLVQKGILSWDQGIESIPPGKGGIDAGWQQATLAHLLHHTSGAPANFPISIMFKDDPDNEQQLLEARLKAVQKILADAPEHAPGSQYQYSNTGYTIAAVIAEKATGKSWESLMQQELFIPLGLGSAGFGPPQDEPDNSQPRGHKSILGFTFSVTSNADNPKLMGPAGSVHMSLTDLARYANEHLLGSSGRSQFLPHDQFSRLHQPSLDDYAKGWVIKQRPAAEGGQTLWHNGSNTMWYSLLTLLPEYDAAIAININDGRIDKAERSAIHIFRSLKKVLQEDHSKTPETEQKSQPPRNTSAAESHTTLRSSP